MIWDINSDITKVIRKYCQQLSANKFDNVNKIDKLLGKTYNLPRLTQEEIDNTSIPLAIKEIDVIVINLPTKKTIDPSGFTS